MSEPKLYIKCDRGVPVKYIYGEEWMAFAMYMDDMGYDTEEEAVKAWEENYK